ncbi:carboxylesterase/lipase family protein [Trinickia dinghuensis]|uniref:Carboxylesterase family protein n=1 Tax=Trinickia dinghuensis TaxID=2291023 RepID=A0A3D8JUI8_9BURK|nr:carboxylesterase family protein [Trinickia dinghuensis]RDU96405.1 carboxylesterase family protein [Trinickia dinghuensis]
MNSSSIDASWRRVVALSVLVPLLSVALRTADARAIEVRAQSAPAVQQASSPRIELTVGTISGIQVLAPRPVRTFLGIPYAAPPTGPLRWQAPQPVARWAGVRQAVQFGPRCMQHASGKPSFRSTRVSEDCLYLNVWAPDPGKDEKRPVLVYFHGGNLNEGDASESRYDGANLAEIGIVTVTVNYRLGVFGFLALPSARHESSDSAVGNYGLLDQVAALRWVRDNIASFGGDPAKVTIAGDTGGAVAVSAHMASPQSRGLFARAIAQSGGAFGRQAVWSRSRAEKLAARFATQVGAWTLPQLRAMSAEQLLAATGSERGPKFVFWPHVDSQFLTDTPEAIFNSGGQAPVPLLLGNRSQEGHVGPMLLGAKPTPENWKQALERLFGEQAAQAMSHYPGNDNDEVVRSATVLAGDLAAAHATWRWMSLHRQTGSGSPVYLYVYDRMPSSAAGASERRASIAQSDLQVDPALGNLNLLPRHGWRAEDYLASGALLRYLVQFVKTGDPNGPRDNPLRYWSALGLGGPARPPSWPAAREEQGGLARQTIDVTPRTTWDRSAARQDFIGRFIATQAFDDTWIDKRR